MERHSVPQDGHAESEGSGICRSKIKQELNLHHPCESLFSEQQKLRHVLDWAHSFLSGDSEIHREFCRADGLILVNERSTSASGCDHLLSCTADGNKDFKGESV